MAGQDKWYFARDQLLNSPSRKCGLDADKELAYRQQAANLIQDMGQRLHVSQLCINTAIVYMHRFYAFHSFTHFHRNAMAAAALFLAAKMEEQPRKLEHVIKVAHLCLHRDCQHILDHRSEYYQEQAQDLVFNENVLLQTLGFDVAIDHPHTHVVKTCSLIRASKDLAQTSYFMASNSLHLTTMCLQYKPTVVACFCIHLASKWSNWEIPQSNEGKHWFNYVDKTVTAELLEHLTSEFLHIFDRCPSRLKKKIMSMPNSQGSPSQAPGSSHSGHPVASSPFDKEPRKIPQEELEKVELTKHQQGLFGPSTSSTASTTSSVTKIDHREYRERQRRAAAAAAAGGTSSSSTSGSSSGSVPPPSQRPPHRWPHPPRDPIAPRDPTTSKDRDTTGVPHPNMRDPNILRENTREPGATVSREGINIRDPNSRESTSSRDHNGIRDISNPRESSRESGGIRDISGLRDLPNPRERDPVNQRDHISQRDPMNSREINSNHNVHAPPETVRGSSGDVRSVSGSSVNLRDMSSSGNVRDSSSVKEISTGREHTSGGMGRELGGVMREPSGQPGQSRSMSGHNRDSSNSRGHNGSSSSLPLQRSSHPRHLPPSQGIPPESKQRSSQQNSAPRPTQAIPAPHPHPVPTQRPPSLFSPPEPQRKPSRLPPQPVKSPILAIPRETIPAPLSPFSSPNEPEPKPAPDILENIVKKEEIIVPAIPQSTVPPPSVEAEVPNNLETDPNLVSSLLKEAIPHRSEKKKKKEKHKHKDKKEKREKHKKNKDKKRESEQQSSSSQSLPNPNSMPLKIKLPREAVANVLPNPTPPTLSDGSPPARLTIKIPKERIKIDPPTPPIQIAPTQLAPQALKIKIPKQFVERESRKRPMVMHSGSREGPPSKTSRSQPGTPHQPSTKVSSHHTLGNGQSGYYK